MTHQLVRWKAVECKDVAGKSILSDYPSEIDKLLNGTLLSQIVSMPKQTPIYFNAAINLVIEYQKEEWESGRMVRYPNFWSWHLRNFISWHIALGYHIELAGDEFEH
jgi:hypothetical protein